jgi:tetratricopeptide (TPR) repeat protein
LNNLAWVLAVSTDPELQDPQHAVGLAFQAVMQAPDAATPWNTLGVAHYRNGEWSQAIRALEKSLELRSSDSATSWLFLSMAHCQLGQHDEARKWFDRANAWMRENAPHKDDVLRFRAEARQLLATDNANDSDPEALERNKDDTSDIPPTVADETG